MYKEVVRLSTLRETAQLCTARPSAMANQSTIIHARAPPSFPSPSDSSSQSERASQPCNARQRQGSTLRKTSNHFQMKEEVDLASTAGSPSRKRACTTRPRPAASHSPKHAVPGLFTSLPLTLYAASLTIRRSGGD